MYQTKGVIDTNPTLLGDCQFLTYTIIWQETDSHQVPFGYPNLDFHMCINNDIYIYIYIYIYIMTTSVKALNFLLLQYLLQDGVAGPEPN